MPNRSVGHSSRFCSHSSIAILTLPLQDNETEVACDPTIYNCTESEDDHGEDHEEGHEDDAVSGYMGAEHLE